jgi:hypothetical protein
MKNRVIKSQKLVFQILISGLLYLNIACSNSSNQADFKLFPVRLNEKWGYINKQGEYVINPQFRDADFFYDSLAKVVSFDGKTGFINPYGEYVISAQYKDATPFSGGLAFVVPERSDPVCINKSGITQFSLDHVKYVISFSDGLAVFSTNDEKSGFVDKTGKTVADTLFENVRTFSEGLAAIKQHDKWGFIDKTGKIVINPQFDATGDFKNGKAWFRIGGRSGYIDAKGSYVINSQFDGTDDFSNGMALIKFGRKYGYINKKGTIVINPQFENVGQFRSGLALIEQGGKYGYINKKGEVEITPQFNNASVFWGDIAFVEDAGKWGIIDKKGKYLVNPQFDRIKTDNKGLWLLPVFSDCYDAAEFIGKFFAGCDIKYFDGFAVTSTLRDIMDYRLYRNVNANGKYMAYINDVQKITDEISVIQTQFHFTNPIYEDVTSGDGYNGTKTTKEYRFEEEISTVKYLFALSGDANGKGGAIAFALKTGIENRYRVRMTADSGRYFIKPDKGRLGFTIEYDDYTVSFEVLFNSTAGHGGLSSVSKTGFEDAIKPEWQKKKRQENINAEKKIIRETIRNETDRRIFFTLIDSLVEEKNKGYAISFFINEEGRYAEDTEEEQIFIRENFNLEKIYIVEDLNGDNIKDAVAAFAGNFGTIGRFCWGRFYYAIITGNQYKVVLLPCPRRTNILYVQDEILTTIEIDEAVNVWDSLPYRRKYKFNGEHFDRIYEKVEKEGDWDFYD